MKILTPALLLALLSCAAVTLAQETPVPVEAPTVAPETPAPALGSAEDALRLARELGARVPVQPELEEIRRQFELDRQRFTEAFGDFLNADFEPTPSGQVLRELRQKLTVLKTDVERWRTTLSRSQRRLTEAREQLQGLNKRWAERLTIEKDNNSPEALLQRIQSVLDAAAAADLKVAEDLQAVLEVDNVLLAHEDTVKELDHRLQGMLLDLRQGLMRTDAAPIWEILVPGRAPFLGVSTVSLTPEALLEEIRAFLQLYGDTVEIHFALFFALLIGMVLLRRSRYLAQQEDLQSAIRVLNRPVSGVVLLVVFLSPVLYPNMPSLVTALVRVVSLVPVLRLVPVFVTPAFRLLVYVVTGLFALDTVYALLSAESGASRLFLLVVTSVGLWATTMGVRRLLAHEQAPGWPRPGLIRMLANGVALLLVVATLANVFGAVGLADYLAGGFLTSAYLALGLYVGTAVLADFIQLLVASRPLQKIRAVSLNREIVSRRLIRAVRWVAAFFWILLTLERFEIGVGALQILGGAMDASISVGAMELSVGGVILFVLAVYVAVLLSRLIRFFLDADVLPRMHLPRGVPGAVSTTVHYVVVGLGILIAISAAGLDLSNLAIIVGALGVGIGFGLQNLVNNFVSGLILLFERPIQAGDTVQVGELIGVVHAIGIRASRVRTYGGSEVIVPNGDLVSSQVINWTLSDRNRRIEIPVGVAYRHNPSEVLEVLERVVDEQEEILKDPPPAVHFDGFGDSALNFWVYVWARDYEHGLQIRTAVSAAIYDALAQAGMEIPFPQRDLHLRSVDEEAGQRLTGATDQGRAE